MSTATYYDGGVQNFVIGVANRPRNGQDILQIIADDTLHYTYLHE